MKDTFTLTDINGGQHITQPDWIKDISNLKNGRIRIHFYRGLSFVFKADGQEIFERIRAYYGGVTRTYRIWGPHRRNFIGAKEPSVWYNLTHEGKQEEGCVRLLQFRNHDTTGTKEYTEVVITRESEEKCNEEFDRQLYDGGYFAGIPGEYIGNIYDGNNKEYYKE